MIRLPFWTIMRADFFLTLSLAEGGNKGIIFDNFFIGYVCSDGHLLTNWKKRLLREITISMKN